MSQKQFDEISRLLLAYSAGDYTLKGTVSDEVNELDMIISGINMLGEELESTNVSRDFFLSIFNTVTDLVFVINKNGIILDANDAVTTLLGYEKEEVIKKHFESFLAASSLSLIDDIKSNLKGEKETHVVEANLVNKKGNEIIGLFTNTKLHDRFDKFNGYLLAVKDITRQKKNESLILQAIISTQQAEQRRVADDLHDSLGQELSMAKLMVTNLSRFNNDNKDFMDLLETCQEIVDNAIEHLREICFDLMPNVLIRGGLPSAISDLVNKLNNQKKIKAEFALTDNFPRMISDLEIVVYRIVQEFINNMIKHSTATKLFVNLYEQNDQTIRIELKENGQGFDIKKLEQLKENRGYSNIKSNINAFDGKYTLESSANGTELIIEFPKTYIDE